MNETKYEKKEIKGKTLYNINWSEYLVCEKFNILKKLNEMTGIYVIFTLNKYKRLTPIFLGGAWYTGLRTTTLKLFNPTSIDPIPQFLKDSVANDKNYIKYLEIYILDDYINIFSKLRENYTDVYYDSNGIEIPENIENVKLIDANTKTHHKS